MLTVNNSKQIVNGPIANYNIPIVDFLFVDPTQVCGILTRVNTTTGEKYNVPLIYGTDYSVTKYIPDGTATYIGASTGTFILNNSIILVEGESITMYRKSTATQKVQYPLTGAFPSATHEAALDYLTMLVQEMQENLSRCATVPISTLNFTGDLPYPNPGKALIINEAGNGLTLSSVAPDELTDAMQNAVNITQNNASLAQAAMGNVPSPVALNYLRRNSDNTALENRTPLQVLADIGGGALASLYTTVKDSIVNAINELHSACNSDIVNFGDFSTNQTLTKDCQHKGTAIANCAFLLPTESTQKMRNFLFDFNVRPGVTLTPPSNISWVNGTPTFIQYPGLTLNLCTNSGMVVTCPGTSGQYANLNNIPFNGFGSNPWKIILKHTPTQVGVAQHIFGLAGHTGLILSFNTSNFAVLYLSSNNSSWDIASAVASSTNAIVNGTTYFHSVEFTGTQYLVKVSTDYNPSTGIGTWTTVITITSSTAIYSTGIVPQLGAHAAATPYKGSIDLNNSSIVINNGSNLLKTGTNGRFINRVILDTLDGGTSFSGSYIQRTP